ncbi:hypothetical protein LHK_02667 [Laribacter hongkongensis HLHK9]|uniref:Uncharacterized protein n=2 Tax=Laribacter hongkongensis TaxID=168471 RepID=C1DCN0_LARHH|nr:hypothetical protein LHK_02667 [Laribacter hongkongensis HLHK9]ASJ25530.1 hypothetical protein LHGZ1_2699 [Laribacter hongkongensis]
MEHEILHGKPFADSTAVSTGHWAAGAGGPCVHPTTSLPAQP